MKRLIQIIIPLMLIALLEGPTLADPFGGGQIIGKEAPDFTLQDINGKRLHLSELKGKVVLLNFWATWCPPCIVEFSSFVKLKNKTKNKPFEIVAIAIDSPLKNISAFARKKGANFPVLYDPEKKVSRAYGVFSLPTTFLIDKNGRVVERFFGAHQWDGDEFKKKIEKLF